MAIRWFAVGRIEILPVDLVVRFQALPLAPVGRWLERLHSCQPAFSELYKQSHNFATQSAGNSFRTMMRVRAKLSL